MALTDKNTVYNWFKTGLKPTQTHFWNFFDSIRWKQDKVPAADVDGLDNVLQNMATNAALNNHKADEAAHSELFEMKVNKVEGKGLSTNDFTDEYKEQFDGHLNNTTVHGSYAIIFGNKFQLIKHPLNNDLTKVNTPQNNDFILNGFRNNTTLWKEAQLIDEDNLNLDESWIVYNSTDTTPEQTNI